MASGLVEKYGRPVPRYTSYPTAPHFHGGVTGDTYRGWLAAMPEDGTLSLYVHIPYCDRLCWFCGCHTKQIKRYSPITTYLVSLRAEIEAVAGALAGRGQVRALHFGGGSPTMLTPDDLRALVGLLRERFDFAADAEVSVEIDPNDMDEARFDALADIGMTRASLGVQDFDPRVQAAINRIQTFEQTRAVVEGVRRRGARSVNLDVLYGLPYQTMASISRTVEQVLALEPDRVAVFGYAHVPWIKKHQTMIDEACLPTLQTRFEQARLASSQLLAAGLEPIGFDHFARPDDGLAIAARNGTLHRNFQGYTVDGADALIGFGASAIGQLPQGYIQNVVATGEYERQALADGVAVARGFAVSGDDVVRAHVIERLMCDFALSFDDLRQRFGAAADGVMGDAMVAFDADADGLLAIEGDRLLVTERGKPFVRSIAACFDAYLKVGEARYSLAV